jgi:hypothetical protein
MASASGSHTTNNNWDRSGPVTTRAVLDAPSRPDQRFEQ